MGMCAFLFALYLFKKKRKFFTFPNKMKKYSKAQQIALIIAFILLTNGDELMANNDQLIIFDKILEKILYETLNDPAFFSLGDSDQLKILKEIFNILNRHFLKIQIKQHDQKKSKENF
jgi:hypothetical protein